MLDWLPEIVKISDMGGNWDSFLERIYRIFYTDIVQKRLIYKNTLVRPADENCFEDDKLKLFWHIIQKQGEKERQPDLRRMERIPWIKPITDNIDSQYIYLWREKKGHELRDHILLDDKSYHHYLIVLSVREKRNYTDYFLITAFPPEKNYLKNLLKRYKKANPGITEVRTPSTLGR
ncbi:MAG: hypothetical protein P9X26_06370 [Candidatus Stygibacter frigidus]|nr:hypothetical protein [Candidatus Stygibacter frigidus]